MSTTLWFNSRTAMPTENKWSSGNNDARFDGTNGGWQPLGGGSYLATVLPGGININTLLDTVAGPTSGVEFQRKSGSDFGIRYVSVPLSADVTISGTITFNLWGLESAMANNAAINCAVYVIDGATGTITQIIKTARITELGTAASANNFTGTPTSTACKRGDRIMAIVFCDDAGTMAAAANGATFITDPAGVTGAQGDSWVQFTETITFEGTPAGSTIYLTDTASDVVTASVDREAWTSRGAGVVSDVVNTAAGWTAPIQLTDTAGGTVVDWFTRRLVAFTLGGAVICNIRLLESAVGNNVAPRVEIAVVDADGTNPVAWAVSTSPIEPGTSEGVTQFWVSGDDLAVADGKRLRIRLLIDDTPDLAMASGGTATIFYAGTTGGASGDTFLTFAQTLTEFTAAARVPYVNPMPPLIAQ